MRPGDPREGSGGVDWGISRSNLMAATILGLAVALGLVLVGPRLASRPHAPERPGVELEPVAAVDAAWRRVAAEPRDARAWAELGDAQAEVDDLEAAEQAYRSAVRLGDTSGLAFARLGFLLYGRGRDAEALVLLREAERRGARVPMLGETVRRLAEAEPAAPVDAAPARPPTPLAALGGRDATPDAGAVELDAALPPPPPTTPGGGRAPTDRACELALGGDGGGLRATVLVDGQPLDMVVDTGATRSLVTAEAAARIGLEIDRERSFHARTANGPITFPSALLPPVELAGRSTPGLRVAICEGCGVEAFSDGLLGLDLVAGLGLELDVAGRRARFADCR